MGRSHATLVDLGDTQLQALGRIVEKRKRSRAALIRSDR